MQKNYYSSSKVGKECVGWVDEEITVLFFLQCKKLTVSTMTLQLDKEVLTHWSIGGCKMNSTTLIKTSCAKKEATTLLSTTTTTTLAPLASSTTPSFESCLEEPDGTCKFLFYDTSLTDMQIGIILLISSLVILCTCLIIIVKILNSMMKGRHCRQSFLNSKVCFQA